jgi:phosphate uptake regulator
MKRRLIQQKDSFTLTIPIKWVRDNNLEKNDEINVIQEDNKLVLQPGELKEPIKKTEVKLTPSNFKAFRSLIGGLYRRGYDEIKVLFKDPKVISELQKTADMLYGFEVFDIDDKSCIIKSVFKVESVELKSVINKMVNIVKTMQNIITQDIKNNDLKSKEELWQFRNSIYKQRDLVARTIVKQRLLDHNHFPYYLLAFYLWHIARNYAYFYVSFPKNYKAEKQELAFLNKLTEYFNVSFTWIESEEVIERYEEYMKLMDSSLKTMSKKGKVSVIYPYCTVILLLIQSCTSSILQLSR